MTKKKNTINTDELTPEQKTKLERLLHPRDKILSLRFKPESIDAWKKAAEANNQESLTDWIERVLNTAAAK